MKISLLEGPRRNYHYYNPSRETGHPNHAAARTPVKVLFVCEDNSALSIMAESILRAEAPARFSAASAGCRAAHGVHPSVIEFLAAHHLPVANLVPKSVAQFRGPGAAQVDFVITLSDAAEACCGDWPGKPLIVHWNIDGAGNLDTEEALRDGFWTLKRRIAMFAALPHGKLSRRVLERRMLTLQAGYL
jgi:protein-tyrosine-phosphatase